MTDTPKPTAYSYETSEYLYSGSKSRWTWKRTVAVDLPSLPSEAVRNVTPLYPKEVIVREVIDEIKRMPVTVIGPSELEERFFPMAESERMAREMYAAGMGEGWAHADEKTRNDMIRLAVWATNHGAKL